MAASPYVSSVEESNFLKLAGLLIRIGPQAVRYTFDHEFPPTGLTTTLTTKKNKKILQDLKSKRIITSAQWDLLFPTAPTLVDSVNFDITLMVCLLRNLAGFQIIDKDPKIYVYDTSKQANISRIKYYRNYIVHSKNGETQQQEFTDIWDCVSKAIVSLDGNLQQQVYNLSQAPVDVETLRLLRQNEMELELVKSVVSSKEEKLELMETKVSINEQKLESVMTEHINAKIRRQNIIKEWTTQDKKYKDTSATKFVLDTLSTNKGVIVTGPPGCGKSAVAHHVALIYEGQGYELYPIKTPKDIEKVFCKDKKQFFIIDDICGRFVFDQRLSFEWIKEVKSLDKLLMSDIHLGPQNGSSDTNKMSIHKGSDDLGQHAMSSQFKVIATCRENIYKSKRFPTLSTFDFKCCSFSKEFILSDKELNEIATSYVDEETLSGVDPTLFDFFPLLCSLFCNKKDKRLFTHPTEVIEEAIKDLKNNSHTCFIALALLVLYNNDLKKEALKEKEVEHLIEEICQECDIEQAYNKKPDQVTFNRLVGEYICETEECYTAVHDKMFDIIAISVSQLIMGVVIKNAPSEFIRNRMQLKCLGESDIHNIILIAVEHEESYLSRMEIEIKNANYQAVFDNLNTKKEEYRNRLQTFFDEKIKPGNFPITSNSISPLHIVTSLGYVDLVHYMVENHNDQIDLIDANGKTPFMYACENGHVNIIDFFEKYLLKHVQIDKRTINGETSLHLAASRGYIEVVEKLVSLGFRVNDKTNENETPLYLASSEGHYNTVTFLLDLNRNKKDSHVDTRIKDKNGWSALHIACLNGHTTVAELLVANRMNVNDTVNDNWTPLYLACLGGHYNTVKLLLQLNGDDKDSRVNARIKNKNGWTALHIACLMGHTEVAGLLIANGMDVNDTINDKWTPLYLACKGGHYNTVKLLLELNGKDKGSRVNTKIKNKNGWTALHTACYKGHREIVKLLIDNGMSVNDTTNGNNSPLYLACHENHYNTVKLLLELNGDDKDSRVDTKIKDGDGWTALHIACYKGLTEIVDLLIASSIEVNSTTDDNRTPLYLASEGGYYNTVKLLLTLTGDDQDGRIDTMIKDKDGQTALHVACYEGHTEVAELLITSCMDVNDTTDDNRTPLYLACEEGHYNTVKLLLKLNGDHKDSRVDTRIKDEIGATALHIACFKGHTEVVDLLIANSMKVNDTTNDNRNPLYLASEGGFYNTVKLLLTLSGDDQGGRIDTRIKDKDGQTALHVACYEGHTEVAELLIANSMDVNEMTDDNRTPLYLACEKGHINTAKLLLGLNGDGNDSRVDTTITNEIGATALHIACFKGHTGIVELLVANSIEVNNTINYNTSPLYLACQEGHYNTVKLLLELNGDDQDNCVDTRIKNEDGWTSLHIACYEGHTEVVELLIANRMDVNDTTYINATPLHLACQGGHYNTVKLLMDLNGDDEDSRVNTRIKDLSGWTALHIACFTGHTDIVDLLIAKYTEVNDTTLDNRTPLYQACQEGHYDIVKLLLDLNEDDKDSLVDTRIMDTNGWTALHTACYKGHTGIVELLVAKCIKVNDTTHENRTPLYLACQEGHYNTVKLLLELNRNEKDSRVDTRIKDKNGWTALHTACFNGHIDNVELLIIKGIDVNKRTNEDRLPLHLACQKGHINIVELLLEKKYQDGERIKRKDIRRCIKLAHYNGHGGIVGYFEEFIPQHSKTKCRMS